MAVIVINLYNRGHKTKRAPVWLRVVTLVWLSKIMFLKHDLFKFAKDVVLVSTSISNSNHAHHKTLLTTHFLK